MKVRLRHRSRNPDEVRLVPTADVSAKPIAATSVLIVQS
jgi:hypothetical protein